MKNYKNITVLELASLVSQKLRDNEIDSILVGGACVSIYSENKYMSKDLDFVTFSSIKEIKPVLELLGFTFQKTNRFIRQDCPFYLEFLPYPVTIGSEINLDKFKIIKTKKGNLKILTPADSVKDRLSAYYHWNDTQSLEQAILVFRSQIIDIKEIESWSKNEGELEKFKQFLKNLQNK